MCGIFGVLIGENSAIKSSVARTAIDRLFRLSESRGTESSGLVVLEGDSIHVLKEPLRASKFIRTKRYREVLSQTPLGEKWVEEPVALMGHSRLVTDGSQEIYYNNQPVLKDGIVCVHNGIIVNVDALWAANPTITRTFDIDTEILLSLVRKHLGNGDSLPDAMRRTYELILGNASIGMMFSDLDHCVLATDCGSLYSIETEKPAPIAFASEKYILSQLANNDKISDMLGPHQIHQIHPRTGRIIDLKTLGVHRFSLEEPNNVDSAFATRMKKRKTIDYSTRNVGPAPNLVARELDDMSLLYEGKEKIRHLRRCVKCVLPETFPFIEFDEEGVCNYCHAYDPVRNLGVPSMERILENSRSDDGSADIFVMLSGGRDSSFALHYLKTEMDMNPIAYTYDWGMVTDIARRNVARLCGQLGVEHILVSADIRQKREFIRRNILAWLKRPVLGMVPLFMAGDKHWYQHANNAAKQLGLDIIVLSTNDLEKTHFKVGFCGIPPISDKARRGGDREGRARLVQYYLRETIRNPFYINSSIVDTITGFISFYQLPKNYLRFFEHYRWNEEIINSALIGEYGWETDPETPTTWRIGDGTAQFYNYIYYTIAGFTENDTFRSNQIREGLVTRDFVMKHIYDENKPRYNGIRWYLNVVGLGRSFNRIIGTINSAPKLYAPRRA